MAREWEQDRILWQINLEDTFDMLFSTRKFFLLGKFNGKIIQFQVPHIQELKKELEQRNISVEQQTLEIEPFAPIRYMTDFIARTSIFNQVRATANSHLLIHSEPLLGKSSILHVLRDLLAEKARCFVFDAQELLADAKSFQEFEKNLIGACLRQHYFNFSDLTHQDGYRAFRSLVDTVISNKSYCLFGIDNFTVPHHFDKENLEEFWSLIRSLMQHPQVRLVFTCTNKEKNRV